MCEIISLLQHMLDLVFALLDEVLELIVFGWIILGLRFEAGNYHGLEILLFLELIAEGGD